MPGIVLLKLAIWPRVGCLEVAHFWTLFLYHEKVLPESDVKDGKIPDVSFASKCKRQKVNKGNLSQKNGNFMRNFCSGTFNSSIDSCWSICVSTKTAAVIAATLHPAWATGRPWFSCPNLTWCAGTSGVHLFKKRWSFLVLNVPRFLRIRFLGAKNIWSCDDRFSQLSKRLKASNDK